MRSCSSSRRGQNAAKNGGALLKRVARPGRRRSRRRGPRTCDTCSKLKHWLIEPPSHTPSSSSRSRTSRSSPSFCPVGPRRTRDTARRPRGRPRRGARRRPPFVGPSPPKPSRPPDASSFLWPADLCVEIKILRRVCAESSSTPSTRRLLDGVAMLVPYRSTEPGRPRHRREIIVHPTHRLISTQPLTLAGLLFAAALGR